jgi:glyoxylase-like metal-dependent hydrolase (beta-lactamase superfamily II)
MSLFFHYCSFGFSNCYVLGEENTPKNVSPQAIIIDPGAMDKHLLEYIENNNFTVRAVLVTHDHRNHIQGLKAITRIYNPEIFAMNHTIFDMKTTPVENGNTISIGPFSIDVISIPGHSADSVVYRIGNMLFTGDVLSAGLTGETASVYCARLQIDKLHSRIFTLPGDYVILPGHGPPTTLEAERHFNIEALPNLNEDKRKPRHKISL